MWVSRVDELESPKDAISVTNPFMMQNNTDSLRSPLTAQRSAAAGRVTHVSDGVTDEAGVIISLSKTGRSLSPSYVNSLSGVDVNLFAAD